MSTETETMDDVVKRYAKKWSVPENEAADKILMFLEGEGKKKVEDRTTLMPTANQLFPTPLGNLSKKVQDVSQALLTSEWTKRSMAEMRQPPQTLEEITTLKDRMSSLEDTINSTMKSMQDTLEAKNQKESQQEILDKITEQLAPLKEKVENLETAIKAEPTTPEGTVIKSSDDLIKAQNEATAESKKFLEAQGITFDKTATGLSAAEQLEMYKETIGLEKWKIEQEWKRDEKLAEIELKKLTAADREKTIREISGKTLKRIGPLIDAFTDEGEQRIRRRGTVAPGAKTWPCPKCKTPISVEGTPDKVVCPKCKTAYSSQG